MKKKIKKMAKMQLVSGLIVVLSATIFLNSCKEDLLENQLAKTSNLNTLNALKTLGEGTVDKKSIAENLIIVFPEGKQGYVYEAGSLSKTISNAVITFIKEDEDLIYVATTDQSGLFSRGLKPGNYFVTVTAKHYYSYYHLTGYLTVPSGQGFGTSNFFLTPLPQADLGKDIKWYVYDQTSPNYYRHIGGIKIQVQREGNRRMTFTTYSSTEYEQIPLYMYNAQMQLPDYLNGYFDLKFESSTIYGSKNFTHQILIPDVGAYDIGLYPIISF